MEQSGAAARLRHQEYVELAGLELPEAALKEAAAAAAEKPETPNA